ncbi:MAG: squalene--hopene cyclase [Synechococcales cyanobacterium CRU_2_2]|nr:squalene--hopene cyclase [Synechococcales cyanobacterium CRU_2_2]
MQVQDRDLGREGSPSAGVVSERLAAAIAANQSHLLALQDKTGYWQAELESNVTMAAEVVLLHKIWGTDKTRPLEKVVPYILGRQVASGGWELFYGDGGELSTSIEAYAALKVLGMPATDPAMQQARAFIISKGGVTQGRIFTKFHLALIGCYSWRGIPSIPPWVMLLPNSFPIYEMSSWARGSTVPLMIVFDQKPVFAIDSPISLDELYTEGYTAVKPLPAKNDWSDIFLPLDQLFKFAEDWNLVPFRKQGIAAAEKWILERQEATGDWGGIIPAMLNSMLALRTLGYDVHDPVVQRGLQAIDNFALETEETYRMQACVSPVWDTAWVVRALVESGCDRNHPAITQGAQWLLNKQIFDYGDWAVKNPHGQPGAWAFEFENRFYPDLDDTAVVVMTLNQVLMDNEQQETVKRAAMQRAANWCGTMQCKAGGWAAFDIDNDQDWLNQIPYGDLKAMIDPNTADVSSRVLEMVGETSVQMEGWRVRRGLDYLLREQEEDGSWFGRWGVNYIYGTSGALSALALVQPEQHQGAIARGAQWLLKVQNPDGGWGETCFSYNDARLKGQGDSTASQTAWALIGLLAAGEGSSNFAEAAIAQGVTYLLDSQRSDGTWDEDYFTGTGFPGHFYLKYHLYQQYFPLLALGRYRRLAL